jgi:protein-tyrosine phosphatase
MGDAARRGVEPAPPHAGFDAPMRVDWLSRADLGTELPGRIGLTFLPGKRGRSSRYPGHTYRRDAGRDLEELRAQGVHTLVLLVEDAELERWSNPGIATIAERAGLRMRRFPIPDGGAPTLDTMAEIQAVLREARGSGDVAVACMGGVGRTGMVAACALVDAGSTAARAIARVREVRHPTAVETEVQERLVVEWELRRRALADAAVRPSSA